MLPYSVGINFIELHDLTDSDGRIVESKDVLERLAETLGTMQVSSEVVQYEGDNLSSINYYVSTKPSAWRFVYDKEIDQNKLVKSISNQIDE